MHLSSASACPPNAMPRTAGVGPATGSTIEPMGERADNWRLRAAREQTPSGHFPGRCLSRTELADLVAQHVFEHHGEEVPVDRKYIAKLEDGRIRWPNAKYRAAFRDILSVGADEALGFVSANAKRAAALLAPIDQRIVAEGTDVLGPLAPSATPAVLAQAFEEVFAGTREATDDEWADRVERYGHDYMSLGAAELQARLAGELLLLRTQVEHRSSLWPIAARLATVMGKTLPSVGSPAGALRWYRIAIEAADRGADQETKVWVRGRAALALAYEGAALPAASAMAQQALVISDRPSLGRLNALLAIAHTSGLQGDPDGARFAWAQAQMMFEQLDQPSVTSDFAVPEWRLAVIGSMLMARLGDEPASETIQRIARRSLPDSVPRFATHLDLHQGLLLVRQGDVSGGLARARSAMLALPPERHSLSLRLMLSEIEKTALTQ